MSRDQIAWARAVAEESYDGQLIRDLCNALEKAQEKAFDEGAAAYANSFWDGEAGCVTNPHRDIKRAA